MDKPILGFFGQYRFLSNFHLCKIEYEDLVYNSTENAYQAAKFPQEMREQFTNCSPAEAKRLNRLYNPRKDWDLVKVKIMDELLVQKFSRDPERQMLLDTGDRYLEETNTWGDTFWGVCKGKGHNTLGMLLMEIRCFI